MRGGRRENRYHLNSCQKSILLGREGGKTNSLPGGGGGRSSSLYEGEGGNFFSSGAWEPGGEKKEETQIRIGGGRRWDTSSSFWRKELIFLWKGKNRKGPLVFSGSAKRRVASLREKGRQPCVLFRGEKK